MAQTKSSQPGAGGGSNPRAEGRIANSPDAASPRARADGAAAGAGGTAALPIASRGRRPGNPLIFLREVRSELRKVAWPTQRETINLTIVVIALSIAVGLFLGGFDYVFQELFKWLLEATAGGAAL